MTAISRYTQQTVAQMRQAKYIDPATDTSVEIADYRTALQRAQTQAVQHRAEALKLKEAARQAIDSSMELYKLVAQLRDELDKARQLLAQQQQSEPPETPPTYMVMQEALASAIAQSDVPIPFSKTDEAAMKRLIKRFRERHTIAIKTGEGA